MLFGTNDVRNLHLRIVDDGGEIVERRAVGPLDHRIGEQRTVPFDMPADMVVELHFAVARNQEPQDPRLPLRRQVGPLSICQIQRPADVDVRALLAIGLFTIGVDLSLRGEIAVSQSGRFKLSGSFAIQVAALRLIVRSVRPADLRPFIPVESQPAEGLQNGSEAADSWLRAWSVSSIRKMNWPPVCLAHNQLNRAVRMPPICM